MKVRIVKPERKALEDLYKIQHLTSIQIAALYGVSKRQVLRWMHSYKIDMRLPGRGLVAQGSQQPTRDELIKWLHEENRSYQEIADMFETTPQAVTYWLEKYNIPHKTSEMIKTSRWYKNREQPQLPTKEEFLQLYEQGWSVERIANDLNMHEDMLRRFCHKQGIELRPNGWRGQKYTCEDGHLVRSIFEQRVDNWLYEHNISHIYEPPLPFDRRYHSDFLANGYYIEIWGVKHPSEHYNKNSLKYNQRKLRKLLQYKEHNLPLIEIYPYDFDTRPERKAPWERRLQVLLQ